MWNMIMYHVQLTQKETCEGIQDRGSLLHGRLSRLPVHSAQGFPHERTIHPTDANATDRHKTAADECI